ncbi:hypothetical protein ACOSQ4_002325 [Xanthoceras sorbifolium]
MLVSADVNEVTGVIQEIRPPSSPKDTRGDSDRQLRVGSQDVVSSSLHICSLNSLVYTFDVVKLEIRVTQIVCGHDHHRTISFNKGICKVSLQAEIDTFFLYISI